MSLLSGLQFPNESSREPAPVLLTQTAVLSVQLDAARQGWQLLRSTRGPGLLEGQGLLPEHQLVPTAVE